jgi:hypothetical protein
MTASPEHSEPRHPPAALDGSRRSDRARGVTYQSIERRSHLPTGLFKYRLEIMHEVGEIFLVTTAGVRRVLLLFVIGVLLLPTIRK